METLSGKVTGKFKIDNSITIKAHILTSSYFDTTNFNASSIYVSSFLYNIDMHFLTDIFTTFFYFYFTHNKGNYV